MPGEDPCRRAQAASGGDKDSGGKRTRRPLRHARRLALSATALPAFLLSGPALAQNLLGRTLGAPEVIQAAIFVGLTGTAMLAAIFMIRERTKTANENVSLRERLADLNASLQRSEALLNLRDQRMLVWSDEKAKPELVGSLPADCGAPEGRSEFLAFGRWLTPQAAASLERATEGLRQRGAGFDLTVETKTGTPLEVAGRKSAAHSIVRFLSLSETRRALARLKLENQQIAGERDLMRGLLDALDMPAWLREPDGRLAWVNRAFTAAVEAPSQEVVLGEARELLGTQAREAVATAHRSDAVFRQDLSTVIAGDRRILRVTDYAGAAGFCGLALDRSEMDAIRAEYESTVRSHADTLDQLTTAVATFDAGEKLRFHNQAFQKLWGLDTGFLASAPDNALVIDRLRSEGKIAEQPEWRRWKENLLSAYRAVSPQEQLWHLPDGRTLRVIANPQPKGGVTWVFENLTEKIDLESRYATAVRVQGETLDSLAEGVAVFGPDGRIRLSNPAFSALWGFGTDIVAAKTHITAISAECERFVQFNDPWPGFVAAVTGFDEERRDRQGQTELVTGSVLRHALIHLPNGQVMLTFVDVTDRVNVERALKEKNEALQRADQLKNDFVQHVSYELRSPLTNIIGFAELLSLPSTGPLEPRQREYLEHIATSSSVLLTIVNDILDLATVDAGIMELDIAEVQVERTLNAAAELVADRLHEHGIALTIDAGAAPRIFHGDETRVRQILYNLLSNAVNYAPDGGTITLTCRQVSEGVEFAVHDDGPGMPPEILDIVFRRFEPRVNGGRRRGAGLGLSIVKSFVELHGGTVKIDTAAGQGTTVTCFFPTAPERMRAAAE
jgi:signal transduction histidine kinase